MIINRTLSVEEPSQSVIQEIEILKYTHHQHIIKLYEVIDDPKSNLVFLIMELAENGPIMTFNEESLKYEYTDSANFVTSEETAARIFFELISALDYLHSRSIAHRDVKPENILHDKYGNIKVKCRNTFVLISYYGRI